MRSSRKEKNLLATIEKTVAVERLACERMLNEEKEKDDAFLENIDNKLSCLNIIDELIKLSHQSNKSNIHKVLIQDCFAILNGFGSYHEKADNMMKAIENTVNDINLNKKIKKEKRSQITASLMHLIAAYEQQLHSIPSPVTIDVKSAQRKSTRMFTLKLPASEDSSPRSDGSARGLSSPDESHDDTDKTPKSRTPK